MKLSFQTTAAIRFGYGLSPVVAAPASAAQMLARLAGPDKTAARYPIKPFAIRLQQEREMGKLRKKRRKGGAAAEAAYKKAIKTASAEKLRELRVTMIRPMIAEDGFRERLVRFWADHFSVSARGKGLRFVAASYIEDAIRPKMTGKFRDLLRAATTHPVMLTYLDQSQSIGPNSVIGKKKNRGLNENLAREILELHTLGVDGAYTQADVRQFAELLTGLETSYRNGFRFRPRAAEPGAETVLGRVYGGGAASINDIYQALDDIAIHPDTARNIARKLVVHFISDTPPKALVDDLTDVFLATEGDLMVVYKALLNHRRAWDNFGQKAKQPFDYLASAMRALALEPAVIEGLSSRETRLYLAGPMEVMGQPYQRPGGPNGWPEAMGDWITPQGLAARIEWALIVTNKLAGGGDPVKFARQTLSDAASARLLEAVGRAETATEGRVLVLASPEFNRR